jgi:hypothetical protein
MSFERGDGMTLPTIHTPAEVVAHFATKGLHLSNRELRRRTRIDGVLPSWT